MVTEHYFVQYTMSLKWRSLELGNPKNDSVQNLPPKNMTNVCTMPYFSGGTVWNGQLMTLPFFLESGTYGHEELAGIGNHPVQYTVHIILYCLPCKVL